MTVKIDYQRLLKNNGKFYCKFRNIIVNIDGEAFSTLSCSMLYVAGHSLPLLHPQEELQKRYF